MCGSGLEALLFLRQSFKIEIDQVEPEYEDGEDEGHDAIQHRMVLLFNARIRRSIDAGERLCVVVHILQDRLYLAMSLRPGKVFIGALPY